MKLTSKLTLLAVTVATFATSSAFADNSTLRTLNDLDRQKAERSQPTVAAFVGGRGLGQRNAMQADHSMTRYEMRSNAHGQTYGVYVPVK